MSSRSEHSGAFAQRIFLRSSVTWLNSKLTITTTRKDSATRILSLRRKTGPLWKRKLELIVNGWFLCFLATCPRRPWNTTWLDSTCSASCPRTGSQTFIQHWRLLTQNNCTATLRSNIPSSWSSHWWKEVTTGCGAHGQRFLPRSTSFSLTSWWTPSGNDLATLYPRFLLDQARRRG